MIMDGKSATDPVLAVIANATVALQMQNLELSVKSMETRMPLVIVHR